ncbi:Arm DNA-binding domain-containing protein [Cytobacillus purgationiresistens]|uniref:AP2-like integrase N-terminal domain-containing protein n=1 Tax=Cytobacillus purgationiresistens TaxID=863449 RepID=A0ABU0ACR0_9BACI|nr:Arm DNA-binding domain-containing protein [Cytobacillus purgationiresistens]MDQ0268669.1 hypothetical protein [Cytobacillus purgationiresistens]
MSGSIHKYETPNGEKKNMVMIEVGESGKRRQKKKMGFKTKKEANNYLIEAQLRLKNGIFNDSKKTTFKPFIEDWFKNIKRKV